MRSPSAKRVRCVASATRAVCRGVPRQRMCCWGAAMVTYELVFPYALVLSGLGLVFLAAFS